MSKSQRTYWIDKTINAIKISRIVIIQGLRRIGKTKLLKTIMDDTMFSQYDRRFIKIGVFGQNDEELLLNLLNEVKETKNTQFALFIDEFQDFDKWNSFFTTMYDFENVRIIATGSISANIEGVKNTEGGRFKYIYMQPLSYNEFILINEKIGKSADELFNDYATMGSYPSQEYTYTLSEYKEQVSDNIIEKIQNQKYMKTYGIDSPIVVKQILLYIVDNIGGTMSSNSISTSLKIDVRTVDKILNYLKNTFIIHEVANSYQGVGKAATFNRKFYLTDHTFYLFIKQSQYKDINNEYQDAVFENIIINQVKCQFSKSEVETRFEINDGIDYDLVVIKDDKKHYFEIKNSNNRILSKGQNKAKEIIKNPSAIYLGETKEENGVRWINYIEFIKEVKKWL